MKFRVVEENDKKSKKNREFLVRWKGHSAEHDTWQPEDTLRNCQSVLTKYKKEHQWSIKWEVTTVGSDHIKNLGRGFFLAVKRAKPTFTRNSR
jgi:hypothetical protein